MKRLKKIILWVLAIGIIVIILAVAGLALFFPKEKVKAMAIEKMSAAFDREVTIEAISVSFLGGIGAYLENIRISNPDKFEERYFLEAKALDVKLRFWPLLKKQIIVDKLILVKPRISLRKLTDGTVNYKFGAVDSLAPAAVKEKLPEESKLAVSAISFQNMAVKKGRLTYIDDSSKIQILAVDLDLESKVETARKAVFNSSGKFSIDSLNIVMDTVTYPAMTVKVDYDAVYDMGEDRIQLNETGLKVNDIRLKLKAEVPRFSVLDRADLKVTSGKTAFNDLLKILPDQYKSMFDAYNINGNIELTADIIYDEKTKDTIQYSGNLTLSEIGVMMSEYPGQIKLSEGTVEFKNDFASVNIPKMTYENNPLQLTCNVSGFDKPKVDGSAKGTFDLAAMGPFLSESGNTQLSGSMTFDIKFAGPVEQLGKMKLQGDLGIANAAYSAETLPEPIQSLNLEAKIDNRDINIENMAVKFPSSDFVLKGKLTDAFPYFLPGYGEKAKKPFLSFEMKSHRLDVDRLFPEAAPGEGVNLAELPLDSLPPIILPDIDGKGIVNIDTLIYLKVEFTNLNGDIDIKNRIINAANVTGKVYTGSVNGRASIDLNDFENPKYSGQYDASDVEVNDFLTRFTSLGGHLFGKVNMKGDFDASGWEPEDLIKSLTLDGSALINQAKLVNFDLINKMAQSFNFKAGGEETIKDLASSFKVENGRVIFDALTFFNNMGDWNVSGSVGFDGSLDYSGDVLLTEKMSSELLSQSNMISGVAGMLQEKESGRVRVGFKLGGTYKNPKPTLDLTPAKDKLQDKLKDKVGDALKGLFGK